MKLYSIGQVSEILDIPIRTIRYYEKIGLVCPCQINESTNYRYYSMDEIFRLDLIRCLGKVLGMPLKTIREYIEKSNDPERLRHYLGQLSQELDAQIDQLLRRRGFLRNKLEAISLRELTETMTPHVEILPERKLSVRKARPKNTEEAIFGVRRLVSETGNYYGHELYLVREFCPDTLAENWEADAFIGLDQGEWPGFTQLTLPSGRYVCITYQNIGGGREKALDLLCGYVRMCGLRPAGRLVIRSTLIDAVSISYCDYYFEMQLPIM